MATEYDFHYTPTGTGVISGREVLRQTEDAINDLGEFCIESNETSQTALSVARQAQASAESAVTAATNAAAQAETAAADAATVAQAVEGFEGRLATAEGNASDALRIATQARTTANSAQTAANAAQTAATQAQDSAAASATAAQASATEASTSANLARAWATSTTSPDGATDSSSPTGRTQSARTWALQAESAAGDVEDARVAAVRAVNTARSNALTAVSGAQGNAVDAVQTAQTTAVSAVNTAKDNALDAISDATNGFVTLDTAQTISGAKAFSTSPTAPTPAAGDSTTKVATTAFVTAAVAAGGSGNAVLLTGDQSIAGTKTFQQSPVVPTTSAGDNSNKAASTAYADGAILNLRNDLFAPTGSSQTVMTDWTFQGSLSALTPSAGDSTTKVATTAFVANAISTAASTTADTYIPKTGLRGILGGWEQFPSVSETTLTVNGQSNDAINTINVTAVTVANGQSGMFWVKVVRIQNPGSTVSLGSSWRWRGNVTPTISGGSLLVLAWTGSSGTATLVTRS